MPTGEYGYMNTNRRHAVAALIAAGLLWGTTVPLTKLALQWLSPGWLTVVRFGLAAAVLLAAAACRRGRGSAQPTALRRAFTPAVLAAGALGYGGSVMVQNAGIIRTSVTHAALLIGAVPVLVAIIAAVWHRTVARPVAWFGFAVSLGGVGLVTAGGGGGGATLAGDGLVLASLLLSATVTVAQGRLLTGRDPVAVTAVQFLGATLGSLPVAVVSEGVPAAPAGAGAVLAVVAVVALALAGTLAAVHPVRVRPEPGVRRGRRGVPQPRAAGRRHRGRGGVRGPGRARAGRRRDGHPGGHRAEQPAAAGRPPHGPPRGAGCGCRCGRGRECRGRAARRRG